MGEAELRVTLAVIRLTNGYHRDSARASIAKLAASTGLSYNGVTAGARAGEKRGTLRREQEDALQSWLTVDLNSSQAARVRRRAASTH